MDRIAFRELLIRYVNGTATPEEKALVDHWYEGLYNNNLPSLKQEELDNIEQEMWAHIEQTGNLAVGDAPLPATNHYRRRKHIYYISAAAVVTALVIGAWLFFLSSPKNFSYEQSRRQNQLSESINNTTAPQQINLQDGSYVILQPNSRIAYPIPFKGATREVYLEGEAFFQVAKDPSRPFYVYTPELVTKVLGTSFDVRAFPTDNTVKVVVHTGKVTVYQRKPDTNEQEQARTNATIIMPNQQISFNRQLASIIKSISKQPKIINTSTGKSNTPLIFADIPVTDLLISIQKAYGIPIVFDEEGMSHCTFTGTFTNESFFERINLVCKAIEATYEQTDGQVIITGHGCQ